jgi:hypothetical protein
MHRKIEEWAFRHDYGHHSNPKGKDRAKILYEKCFVRPTINKCWEILKGDNPDIERRQWANDMLTDLDPKRNGQDNVAMLCGRLTQSACDAILIDGEPESKIIELTLKHYEEFQPRTWDDGTDKAKHEAYKDNLVGTIKVACNGIKEATALDNRIQPEIDLFEPLAGNVLPYFTKPDYNGRGDLKTKWPKKNARSKSGFSAASIPKSIGAFELAHLWQVSGFFALNGRRLPWLLYVNDSDYNLMTADNTPELRADNLQYIVNRISQFHKVTENMLRMCNHTDELFELVSPDFDQLCWQEPPSYLKHAKKLFGDD